MVTASTILHGTLVVLFPCKNDLVIVADKLVTARAEQKQLDLCKIFTCRSGVVFSTRSIAVRGKIGGVWKTLFNASETAQGFLNSLFDGIGNKTITPAQVLDLQTKLASGFKSAIDLSPNHDSILKELGDIEPAFCTHVVEKDTVTGWQILVFRIFAPGSDKPDEVIRYQVNSPIQAGEVVLDSSLSCPSGSLSAKALQESFNKDDWDKKTALLAAAQMVSLTNTRVPLKVGPTIDALLLTGIGESTWLALGETAKSIAGTTFEALKVQQWASQTVAPH